MTPELNAVIEETKEAYRKADIARCQEMIVYWEALNGDDSTKKRYAILEKAAVEAESFYAAMEAKMLEILKAEAISLKLR